MSNDQPNLLIIHTDQLSWWALGCYGGRVVETPNIDRLAAEGARLTNFFTNSAVCTPSRGCFLTGRYPHCHGAYRNNIALNRDEITFARILQDQGYATGYSGKWHLDGTPRPGWVHPDRSMGFEDARFMFNRGHWKKIEDGVMDPMQPTVHPYNVVGEDQTYTSDWLTRKTLSFLDDHWDEPFCYMLSLPDPHTPVSVRSPYNEMFNPDDMPLPSTFHSESSLDWAREARGRSRFGPHIDQRRQELQRFLALYFGEVKLIDDCVGKILAQMERQDILDDTIVIFTSDHGEYAGEHGLFGKNELYETAYRVPLVVRWPKTISAEHTVEEVISTVDFQPTILNLMGQPTCGREQGRDAAPLLQGKDGDWDNEAYIHHSKHRRAGIFTDRFELAYVRDGDPVLFDRINDSEQRNNLYHDPGHRDVVESLTEKIIQHHVEVCSPATSWLYSCRKENS